MAVSRRGPHGGLEGQPGLRRTTSSVVAPFLHDPHHVVRRGVWGLSHADAHQVSFPPDGSRCSLRLLGFRIAWRVVIAKQSPPVSKRAKPRWCDYHIFRRGETELVSPSVAFPQLEYPGFSSGWWRSIHSRAARVLDRLPSTHRDPTYAAAQQLLDHKGPHFSLFPRISLCQVHGPRRGLVLRDSGFKHRRLAHGLQGVQICGALARLHHRAPVLRGTLPSFRAPVPQHRAGKTRNARLVPCDWVNLLRRASDPTA